MRSVLGLRVGELVEVRSIEEILGTLDGRDTLDGLPFTPEMLPSCGKRFRVAKRATRICAPGGMRRVHDAVILEGVWCDGSAHDGCAASCPLLWREAWLRRAPSGSTSPSAPATRLRPAQSPSLRTRDGPRYVCQATELRKASSASLLLNPASYIEDLVSGNTTLPEVCRSLKWTIVQKLETRLHSGSLAASNPCARITGFSRHTPTSSLGLKPGERVHVRDSPKIVATLNPTGRNRGLLFVPEMRAFLGRNAEVLRRVDRIIVEATGEIRPMENTVILSGVACDGSCHAGCRRGLHHFWREVWLERTAGMGVRSDRKD